MLAVVAANQ
ncbi:hypothetical protein Tco_1051533, partial [Tanacetum coccineum]